MMQKTDGLHSILSIPTVYELTQSIMRDRALSKRVQSYLASPSKPKILEIGCGTGSILSEIHASSYLGFDPSYEYILEAQKNFGHMPHHKFICSEFDESKVDVDADFDILLLKGVMHHISDEKISIDLKKSSKFLRSGGVLVTVDPCLTDHQKLISKLLVRLDRGKNVRTKEAYLQLLPKNLFIRTAEVVHQTFPPYDRCLIVAEKH